MTVTEALLLSLTSQPVSLPVGVQWKLALVAVTQLVLWILLTALCIKGVQASAPQLFAEARAQQEMRSLASKGADATVQYDTPVQLVDEAVQGLTAIRLPLVAGMFLLYFLLGYLLYGALLAALASRLDSDADTLQWNLLAGSPLLVVLILSPVLLRAPAASWGIWLTLIPFTAPAAAMLRLPFGLPVWQVAVSVALLLVCFALAAFLAARSYRRHLVR